MCKLLCIAENYYILERRKTVMIIDTYGDTFDNLEFDKYCKSK